MVHVYVLLQFLFPAADVLLTDAAGPITGSFALLALVAVGAALAWIAVRGVAAWPVPDSEGGRADAMRRRSDRAAAPPLRDPDAPGKPRPRAPGAAPTAA
ncbi:DUF6412 domain-containing protein [Nocardiopsis sediminis]|uniref:DUF6412 domain-containing protein n=1 Tax=Nocardiopsis sediminis TaxID=1778267 RepID=A0ABV8FSI9_9ACTN